MSYRTRNEQGLTPTQALILSQMSERYWVPSELICAVVWPDVPLAEAHLRLRPLVFLIRRALKGTGRSIVGTQVAGYRIFPETMHFTTRQLGLIRRRAESGYAIREDQVRDYDFLIRAHGFTSKQAGRALMIEAWDRRS